MKMFNMFPRSKIWMDLLEIAKLRWVETKTTSVGRQTISARSPKSWHKSRMRISSRSSKAKRKAKSKA